MTLTDRVLVELHRAAALAGRPGIAVPSRDLQPESLESAKRDSVHALSRLVRAGRVQPVRKDLVVLPDATGRVTVGVVDLVEVVAPAMHLITGGRALEEHRLTNQHFFSILVLVPCRVSSFSFRGEKAVFMATDPERIWGWQEHGPHYATPERAVIDAVSHARYGVSLPMAVGALSRAAERDVGFLGRLAAAADRYGSAASARRVGLIVDRLFGEAAAAPFSELIGDSRTPVPLRPSGAKQGPVDRKWRVMVNASIEPARVNA